MARNLKRDKKVEARKKDMRRRGEKRMNMTPAMVKMALSMNSKRS